MNERARRLADLTPEQRERLLLRAQERRAPAAPIATIPRRPDASRPAVLSFSQERLWFLEQLEPGTTAYHVRSVLRARGPLREELLAGALAALAERHDSLRTSFAGEGALARQTVAPRVEVPLAIHDLRQLAEAERQPRLEAILREEANRPFDLGTPPLLRATLIRLEAELSVLAFTIHHIVSDGWSLGVIVRDIVGAYGALARGKPARLPELAVQYPDYAEWQRNHVAGQALESGLGFWTSRLADLEPATLPADRSIPATRGANAATRHGQLPAELARQLHELARNEGVSLYIVLLAIVSAALARNTRRADIAVGTPIAGRTQKETEELVGFFVNTLVMRLDCSSDATLAELLLHARDTALDAYAHQSIPFEKVVEALAPERHLGENPLFQVMLALQNAPATELSLEGLVFEPLALDAQAAKFDFGLTFIEDERGLAYAIDYATDVFEAETAERFERHMLAFARAFAGNRRQRLSQIALVDDAERTSLQALSTGRRTDQLAKNLSELLLDSARRSPHATAVAWPGGALSYAELLGRASALALDLGQRGIGTDSLVLLHADRSPETLIGIVGILLAGAGYVPVDPRLPVERVAWMARDSTASAVVVPSADTAITGADELPRVVVPHRLADLQHSSAQAESSAYLIYTSGSTGTPKGVVVPQRAVAHYCEAIGELFQLTASDRVLQFHSLSFDASIEEIFPILLRGGTVVLSPEGVPESFEALADLVESQSVSVLELPTAYWHVLTHALARGSARLPRSVRLVVVGGEAAQPARMVDFSRAAPGVDFANMYGPTEATVSAVAYGPSERNHEREAERIPIGRPIANYGAYVLDERLELAPIGVPGELYLGGLGLARGYHHRAELTAERFVPSPFAPGERLYRTGDIARWSNDHQLEFLGRADHQIKLRGYRIELGEIESALRNLPDVRDAVVELRADGTEQSKLVAYVVVDDRNAVAQIATRLAERLPSYMVPSAFVPLESLPLTRTGKVDRSALPEPESSLARAFEPLRTPTERALAEIWCELLGVESVGRRDDFFELGGHSLLAMQLTPRVRALFGITLPLRALFETPKLADFAERVDGVVEGAARPMLPVLARTDRSRPVPLSYAQRRLWFLEQLTPGTSAYHVPVAVRIRGPVHAEALESALSALIGRHESLRTSITSEDGAPVQRVHHDAAFELGRLELSSASDLHAVLRSEIERPFDLARPPLLRALLVTSGPDNHVLCLTLHHIVTDAWSMNVVVRELIALYEAALVGASLELSPLPHGYVDYAVWQHELLAGPNLQRELDYWVERLRGIAALELPTDRPRPSLRSSRGAAVRFSLSAEQLAPLRRLAREENATLYMTVVAAVAALLARITGQRDIPIGTTIGGRAQRELEGVVGFFVNTLVLRLDVSEELTLRDLLGRAREVCLSAFAHQEVPFEKVVEAIDPQRDPAKTPLFDVMLVMQNAPPPTTHVASASIEPIAVELPTAKFDLMFTLTEVGGGLDGALVYASELFDEPTAERLSAQLVALIAGFAEQAAALVRRLPLLAPAERQKLLVDFSREAAIEPGREAFHRCFERHAREHPSAIALRAAGRELTYGELDAHANRIARLLADAGVGAETRVALLLPRHESLVAALLGTLKAGAAYVPLDPTHPDRRLCQAIEDSGAEVVLTESAHLDRVLAAAPLAFALDRTELPESSSPLDRAVHPEELAYVIYTSGSTGAPKGTLVTHGGLSSYLGWAADAYRIGPGGTSAAFTSVAFDLTVTSLLLPLAVGGVVRLIEGDALDALEELGRGTETYDLLKLTPSHLAMLEQVLPPDRLANIAKLFVIGGEVLHGEQLRSWYERAPGTRIVNEYGPTETVVGSAIHVADPELDRSGPLPIGRPIAGTELYVLDAELEPVPIGAWGELCIGGAGVSRGYGGLPALTAERFVPNPFGARAGSRLYRTGDRCRFRADGVLELSGRLDHQIKLRGHRIELGEIEASLRQHPSIRDAAVVLRSDGGDPRLVAYVVGAHDSAELMAYLAARLPQPMLPAAVVELERLPLAPSGKLDRRALPAPWTEGIEPAAPSAASATEKKLAELYAALLGTASVPLDVSFFSLGGHSLLATQLVARVRSELGIELPLRAIFEAPSVKELALCVEALRGEHAVGVPAITVAPRAAALPMSFAQERLWFIDQLEPGTTAYVIQAALVVDGKLDAAAFERALHQLVMRHEPLRTTFVSSGGTASQRIADSVELDFVVDDRKSVDPSERQALVLQVASDEGRVPFDLERGPLLRVRLLSFAADEHALLLAVHHTVFDGWSASVLVRDLCELYAAEIERREPRLPPLEVQYADYAVWQRDWLEGRGHLAELDYWKSKLANLAPLELPTDRPRPPIFSSRGGRQRLGVDAQTFSLLRELAESEGATPFMLLLAAYLLLLGRHAGRDDIAIGGPIAGRTHRETEELVGLFVNTLVFRVDLARPRTLRELVRAVREVALEAFAHQDTPFELIVKELAPERDPSRAPLVQASFSFQNVPELRFEAAGLTFSSLTSDAATTLVDLMLFANERNGGIDAAFIYAADLFDERSMALMARRYEALLDKLARDPDAPLATLECLAPSERPELVAVATGPSLITPHAATVHASFERVVRRDPEHEALRFGDERVSYAELDARANRLAWRLRAMGAGPDVLVGIALERSIELVVAMLAVLKAGAAYVPLDLAYPPARLAYLMEDTALPLLVSTDELIDSLPVSSALVILADDPSLDAEREIAPPELATPDNLAYVIHTSGSTGKPKGVMITHTGLINTALGQNAVAGVGPGDRTLQFASSAFDASVWEIFTTLLSGGTLELAERQALMPGPDLAALLRERAPTVATLPPTALTLLADGELASLRVLFAAGEACPIELARRLSVGREFYNAYGPTEVTICATMARCDPAATGVSIGRPLPRVTAYVLDDRLRLAPTGVWGELCVGGPGVARGYLRRPELTAERFVPDPFSAGERLYRTGDRCRVTPDGVIELSGRIDDQVKLRGHRIEPGEIIAALRSHPAIADATVVATGAGAEMRLVAYVVAGDEPPAAAALRSFLEQQMPAHMVPSAFVFLASLPLTPSGKVDRRALPEPHSATSVADAAPPATPTEQVIAQIWADVLDLERVGRTDRFFDLGGHSLIATRVITRIGEALGVQVPLIALFESPELGAFAARVDELARGKSESALALVARSSDEPPPLSFSQERVWFLEQLDPGTTAFSMPEVLSLEGALDLPALERALSGIVARHEILRTTYESRATGPVQIVQAPEPLRIPLTDLSSASETERDAQVARFVNEPFDLEHGPVLRAQVLRLEAERHLLLLNVHHIAFDGWSIAVFLRELMALYARACGASAPDLPELVVQYGDFAEWQRRWLSGPELDTRKAYWQRQLAGGSEPLLLPTDRPRPALQSFRGRTLRVDLPVDLTANMHAVCRRAGVTPFMALLAVFDVLLHRYSGQDDIWVGSPIANRPRPELEPLIGYFLNTLVLRADLSNNPTFVELLARIRDVALGAYAHQDIPFEELARSADRDLSKSPLFQVMFILQSVPREELEIPGLSVRRQRTETGAAKFDLLLALEEAQGRISGELEYNCDLFDDETAERMWQHFTVLAAALFGDAAKRIDDVALIDLGERRRIEALSRSPEPARHTGTLGALVLQQAQRTPDAPAIVSARGALGYGELVERAGAVAQSLLARGIGRESIVALAADRSAETLIGLLGIVLSGAAYLPIDLTLPAERIRYLLDDSGAKLAVAPAALARSAKLGELPREVVTGDRLEPPRVELDPDNAAYVIYTSGSTGQPKGVIVPQRAARNLALATAAHFDLTPSDRVLQFHSLSFDASVEELFPAWSCGAAVVLQPERVPDSFDAFAELIERHGVTVLDLPTAYFHVWAAALGAGRARLPRGVRLVIIGGEAAQPARLADFRAAAGERIALCNTYGPTETTVSATAYGPADRDLERERERIPIGKPLAGVGVHVLDRALEPVPIGVAGELYISGAGLARGYLGRAALTAERFVPSPFARGERLYKTGDVVRWLSTGELLYVGRADRQVKLRGYRIELGEIEALLHEHPAVRDAIVVLDDAAHNPRLVAYVVGEGSAPELGQYLERRLPPYMTPSAFVSLDALPLTPTGKLDRRALPPPPPPAVLDFVAPETATEQLLAAIWSDLLGIDSVGRHDSFFALGGHSLLATQLVSRIQRALEIPISLRTVFAAPTLSALCEEIDRAWLSSRSEARAPIVRAESRSSLPLSFQQERLWFFDRLDPGSPVFNIVGGLRITGALAPDALERALESLAERHQVLCTRFGVEHGKPVQNIDVAVGFPLTRESLEGITEAEQQSAIEARMADQSRHRFDLATGPLAHAELLRLAPDVHVLIVVMHHIVSDGWSMGIVMRELTELYAAHAAERAPNLVPLGVQYADFAVWQRRQLTPEVLAPELAYWKDKLAGVPPLALPTDRPRTAARRFGGASVPLCLSRELSSALEALALEQGMTPFMVVLAAFQLLLGRWAGQDDVVVGTPVANRTEHDTEHTIGFFLNNLALRTDVGGEPSVRELLARVRETCLGAYVNQQVPFEQVLEAVQIEREPSRNPLIQVGFTFQNAHSTRLDVADLRFEGIEPTTTSVHYEAWLILGKSEGVISGKLDYTTDFFEHATIERLSKHLVRVLERFVEQPDSRTSDLDLLTDDEHQLLARGWHASQREYPLDTPIQRLFEQVVAKQPDRVALELEGETLSYAELNRRANRLAHRLRRCGVGAEARVALVLERGMELVIAMLGVIKAGGAYVPLDPAWPEERIAWLLADCKASTVLTSAALSARVPADTEHVLALDAEDFAEEPDENPVVDVCGSSLVYVIYTSGSTGRPKGVMLHHRGLVNFVYGSIETVGYDSSSRSVQFSSPSFDASVWDVFCTLLAGGTLCLAPREKLLPGIDLFNWLRAKRISVALLPPSAIAALPVGDLPQLRTICAGGEACPQTLVETWADKRRFINAYGPTEITVCATQAECNVGDVRVSIGRPRPNADVYVLDARGRLAPIGALGELYIGGVGVARGYLFRPDLTAERFVPHPFANGERLYRTGDVCRWRADGELEFVGRADDQVKLRGYRIELGEIEAALLAHPLVREAVVVVRKDGSGDSSLAAYVAAPDAQPTTRALRELLEAKLPRYMVPSAISVLDALPHNSSGKVDRHKLPPPSTHDDEELTLDPPRTPIEEMLARTFAEVLALDVVGIFENFFDLGGHSLLATQIASRLVELLSIEVPVRAVFEAPTVASLAQRVEELLREQGGVNAPPLTPAPRDQPLPLSYAQERLWFLEQLSPGRATYNMPFAFRLRGELDPQLLRRAFAMLVERHESLRTTFEKAPDGRAVQRISPVPTTALEIQSLIGEPDLEARVAELARASAREPFDLESGPLLRAALLGVGKNEHVLLLCLHHVVCDGWSLGVLVREMVELYDALGTGRAPSLEPLPIQYADYAAWQRSYLSGESLERELAFWREQLAGVPALELPTDRPRPPVQTHVGSLVPIELGAELTRRLEGLSRRSQASLFMTLAAAFQVLLCRLSGQNDFALGVPIAGRNRLETEPLIGFFMNMFVLRARLADRPSFHELLLRVREDTLAAYAHQDMPFDKLVDALEPERDLSRSPVFQAVMTLQNTPEGSIQRSGLVVEAITTGADVAKYDLTLSLRETPNGLVGGFEYNTDLFDEASVARWARHFERLLGSIVDGPDQVVSRLALLDAREQQELRTLAGVAIEAPGELVHERVRAVAARRPTHIAIEGDSERLSYAELLQRANGLAFELAARGVQPGTRVAILLERSPQMIVALLAVLQAGGAYVPLDPTAPEERLAALAQPLCVITEASLAPRVPAGWTTLLLDQAPAPREDAPPCRARPDDVAYVIYTSGSTGTPKGVMVSHRSVCRLLASAARAFEIDESSRVLNFFSFAFDPAVSEILMALMNGGTVCVTSSDALLPGPELIQLLRARRISYLTATPSALMQLPVEELPALRTLTAGGEACPLELPRRWANGRNFYNAYGPTEGTIIATLAKLGADDDRITIGRPIEGAQLYVLDADLELVPIGVPGELCIGGVGVAKGYVDSPDLTAERFVPHPFQPGARLYRSGDRVRWLPDGRLEFFGRLDHQVKLRGYRIELGDIEAALRRQATVADAAVVVREDGIGTRRLVAYVQAHTDRVLDVAELTKRLAAELPPYMLPSAIVSLVELPRASSGKIDKRALPEPEQRPKGPVEAPRSTAERILCRIFASLLPIAEVGIDDSFFALGGDSILTIQLVTRARQAGLVFSVKDVFAAPTPAELAALARLTPAADAEQGPVSGTAPLTPAQRWFFEQPRSTYAHFNQALLFAVKAEIDLSLLEQTLASIVRHHDALRLRFVRTPAGIEQHHAPPDDASVVSRLDLGGVASDALAKEVEARCAALQAGLDLENGPLIRVALLDLRGERGARLLIVVHHLVVDGVSWRILLEDLEATYLRLAHGKPAELPPKTTSFRRFAEELRRHAHSSDVESALGHWREQAARTVQRLPRDHAGGDNSAASASALSHTLGADDTLVLLQQAPKRWGASTEECLLAAATVALTELSGGSAMRFTLESHGREELRDDLDLTRTVGWFTAMFPVTLPVAPTKSARDTLDLVKRELAAARPKALSYGLLRFGESAAATELAAQLPAEVSFNYLGQTRGTLGEHSLFAPAPESPGPSDAPDAPRPHLLDVTAIVLGGRLRISIHYSSAVHDEETIARLIERFGAELQALIAACRNDELPAAERFSRSKLSSAALDKVLQRQSKKRR